MTFEFDGELWLWQGDAAWVFITVPEAISDEILEVAPRGPGFGAVKVEVAIGGTTWSTSVFPDSRRGAYVLPVKKAVRTAEAIGVGDRARVHLAVVHAR